MRLSAGSLKELQERGVARIWWENEPLAVFWVDDGARAVSDTCTHADCSLSDGIRDGGVITCPCHGARFSLDTGAVLSFPAVVPVQSFPVAIVDGEVYIETPD
jgi:nitrite reductase/ring-hydroxylating ferredoxin subunit